MDRDPRRPLYPVPPSQYEPVPNLTHRGSPIPRWAKILFSLLAASSIPGAVFTGITSAAVRYASGVLTASIKLDVEANTKAIQATDKHVAEGFAAQAADNAAKATSIANILAGQKALERKISKRIAVRADTGAATP